MRQKKFYSIPVMAAIAASMLFCAGGVYAAHPLITDDTGTQGKGKSQLEINGEASMDKEKEAGVEVKETAEEAAAILSYGLTDSADIVLGVPYSWVKVEEDGLKAASESGPSDVSLELKWRLYENEGFSFALKPALALPTGDEEKGLGDGEPSYGLSLITTNEAGPIAAHMNVGYTRHSYKLAPDKAALREDIWHASAAMTYDATERLQVAGNIGVETNPDRETNNHPAFAIAGIIYSVTEALDVDFGIKAGLNKPETDLTGLAGLAYRF